MKTAFLILIIWIIAGIFATVYGMMTAVEWYDDDEYYLKPKTKTPMKSIKIKNETTMLSRLVMYARWIGTMLIKLLAWPYSLVVWPVAFLLRKPVRRLYLMQSVAWLRGLAWPLWIVLDDQDDYGEEWWLKAYKRKETMWTAWLWSWARNNSVNLSVWLADHARGEDGAIIEAASTTSQGPRYHARYKWEVLKDGKVILEGWQVNQGDRLSQKYSDPGDTWLLYRSTEGWLQFRQSHAGIHKTWLGTWLVNIKTGWNHRGEALLDIRILKYKPEWDAHWEND